MSDKKTASGTADTGASPSEFLKHIQRKPVVVKLNSGVDYRGARQQMVVECSSLCESSVRSGIERDRENRFEH
jgi:hypothetical protein